MKKFNVTVVGYAAFFHGTESGARASAEARFMRDYKDWKPSHWKGNNLIAVHPEHKAPVVVASIEQVKG